MSDPQCPLCGYTADDASQHGDHHLCNGTIPTDCVSPNLTPLAWLRERVEALGSSWSDDDVWDTLRNVAPELLALWAAVEKLEPSHGKRCCEWHEEDDFDGTCICGAMVLDDALCALDAAVRKGMP